MCDVTRGLFVSLLLLAVAGCSEKPFSVSKIYPTVGVSRGGEEVTVFGAGFARESMITVFFGNSRAEYTTMAGSNRILATTPAVARPGRVDVRVVTGNGRQFVFRDAFEFVTRNEMADCVNIGRALNGNPVEQRKAIRGD